MNATRKIRQNQFTLAEKRMLWALNLGMRHYRDGKEMAEYSYMYDYEYAAYKAGYKSAARCDQKGI